MVAAGLLGSELSKNVFVRGFPWLWENPGLKIEPGFS